MVLRLKLMASFLVVLVCTAAWLHMVLIPRLLRYALVHNHPIFLLQQFQLSIIKLTSLLVIFFNHQFCFFKATVAGGKEEPFRMTNTMAFMFESCLMPRICPWALQSPSIDHDYYQCWVGLRSHFSPEKTSDDSQKI